MARGPVGPGIRPRGGLAPEVEDRSLTAPRVLLGLLRARLRLGEDLEHSPAAVAGRVEGAALHQALDRSLVHGSRVDPLAEVPDRGKRPAALPRLDGRLDRGMADVLDSVEPEPD